MRESVQVVHGHCRLCYLDKVGARNKRGYLESTHTRISPQSQ